MIMYYGKPPAPLYNLGYLLVSSHEVIDDIDEYYLMGLPYAKMTTSMRLIRDCVYFPTYIWRARSRFQNIFNYYYYADYIIIIYVYI